MEPLRSAIPLLAISGRCTALKLDCLRVCGVLGLDLSTKVPKSLVLDTTDAAPTSAARYDRYLIGRQKGQQERVAWPETCRSLGGQNDPAAKMGLAQDTLFHTPLQVVQCRHCTVCAKSARLFEVSCRKGYPRCYAARKSLSSTAARALHRVCARWLLRVATSCSQNLQILRCTTRLDVGLNI